MAIDQTLLDTFDKFYQYFNARNFTDATWAQTMDALLDDNVKMKKLDDPGYHEGKADVKKYFVMGNGKADLAFCTIRNKVSQVVAGIGFVSGAADFVDKTSTTPQSPPRPIAYSFAFSKTNSGWKAIHLWGQYLKP